MKTKKIRIHGLQHQFYFWGDPSKPKIFLFHGWLDTGASFDFLAPYLKDFFLIAVDMRGYGKSEHTSNPLGYFFFEYVADMDAILHHFSPRFPVNLLGHSMGGIIASIYAGSRPKRVARLLNVEGFGFRHEEPSMAPAQAGQWLKGLHQKGFPPHENVGYFAKRLRQQNPRLPKARSLFLARHLTKKVDGKYHMAADPNHKLVEPYLFPLKHFYAFCEGILAKCLLVGAEKSEMAKRFHFKNYRRELKIRYRHFPKGTQFTMIPDCGHMVHHEKPEILAEIIRPFLMS